MLSYTNLTQLYQDFTENADASNITFGDTMMNHIIRQICGKTAWPFLEKTTTDDTVDGTAEYDLPYDYRKLINVYITVDSTKYYPKEITNRREWDILTQTSNEADVPLFYFIFGEKISFYPTPATDGNTITFVYLKRVKNIGTADYITGTVTLTNASTAVVGSGTTFTNAMEGRWLKGTTNDEYWYEILTYTDATHLVLDKVFQGDTEAGLSYRIGDMSVLPEGYELLAPYGAARMYWARKDKTKTREFKDAYNELYFDMKNEYMNKTTDPSINDIDIPIINPNLTITGT